MINKYIIKYWTRFVTIDKIIKEDDSFYNLETIYDPYNPYSNKFHEWAKANTSSLADDKLFIKYSKIIGLLFE